MIKGVNLMPVQRQAARQCRRHRQRWLVGFSLYALLLLTAWLVVNHLARGPDRALATSADQVQRRMAMTQQALDELEPKLTEAQQILSASRSVSIQPDWSKLLSLLADLLDEQTVLTNCQLEPVMPGATFQAPLQPPSPTARYRLRLRGMGLSQSAVSAYLLRLEASGLFAEVKLMNTHMEPFGDGRVVGFHIECQLVPKERDP